MFRRILVPLDGSAVRSRLYPSPHASHRHREDHFSYYVWYPTSRPIGRKPRRCASLASINTTAAAASLIPEALPAVTLPSPLKAGRSFATVDDGNSFKTVLHLFF
jgi:hypothetical protein